MTAIFSICGTYRYRLDRHIGDGPAMAVIMVNPSTADATVDDPTIRRLLGFAERLGAGRLIVGNKFAYRATDVRALRGAADPVGPENNAHLGRIMLDAELHLVAWGPLSKLPKDLHRRWRTIATMADRLGCKLHCLGTAACGHPRHPLMLPADAALVEWVRP